MQTTSQYQNIIQKQLNDNEKRKKEELFGSKFFKILIKDNPVDAKRILTYLENKTSDEIIDMIKFIINKKSVQKHNIT